MSDPFGVHLPERDRLRRDDPAVNHLPAPLRPFAHRLSDEPGHPIVLGLDRRDNVVTLDDPTDSDEKQVLSTDRRTLMFDLVIAQFIARDQTVRVLGDAASLFQQIDTSHRTLHVHEYAVELIDITQPGDVIAVGSLSDVVDSPGYHELLDRLPATFILVSGGHIAESTNPSLLYTGDEYRVAGTVPGLRPDTNHLVPPGEQ